jgi:hypothetical protein
VHSPDRPFGNVFGVVASSCGDQVEKLHDKLCTAMRADTGSVHEIFGKWMGTFTTKVMDDIPQAMDVARDLDGIPLDVSWIERQMISNNEEVGNFYLQGYSIPESGSWRGMMSNGGRLLLDWRKKAQDNDNNPDFPPSSVFYKRIVMADLEHAWSTLGAALYRRRKRWCAM